MPTYKDQQGNTVVWNSPTAIRTPMSIDLDGGTHNATNFGRIEAVHHSAASGGSVTSSNLNAHVSAATVTGDDTAGSVAFSFSGSISAGTQLAKINFGTTYTAAPRVLVTVASVGVSGGAGVDYYADPSDTLAGSFLIKNLTAISGSGSGKAAYVVIGAAGG
jgi:hypothetical protein